VYERNGFEGCILRTNENDADDRDRFPRKEILFFIRRMQPRFEASDYRWMEFLIMIDCRVTLMYHHRADRPQGGCEVKCIL
jgi:hypothetical protein